MQYFALNGEIAALAGKKVAEYFKKAVYNHGKPDPAINVHREYVRDVLTLFADKTELTFAQACMIARGNSFRNPYARKMHGMRAGKIPAKIKTINGEIPNPLHQKLAELSELQLDGHMEFMKQGWIWATTLIHPHSKPMHRGASEPDKITEARIVKSIFKHIDETREAHQKRAAEALSRALSDPLVLQMVSDRLLKRVETSMSMRLK